MDSDVYAFFKRQGLQFPRSVITSYVLALQTKPFVILTGISGTGKTKIAQIFAAYLTQGLDEPSRRDRIAFVSVRPDWMDNRGLLGYYNPLTQEYHAPQVLRLLLSARDNPDATHFVILDEMNLAKVEYYFSDFLSVLESRTKDDPSGVPLRLHDEKGKRIQTADEREVPGELKIPANVLFTGTVNVDETTYVFSPKVLDRANVIEFNAVTLPGYADDANVLDELVFSEPDVRALFDKDRLLPFCTKDDFDAYRKTCDINGWEDPLAELFSRLKRYHLHFGYRVINEISRFVNLASEQLKPFDRDDRDNVVDLQILQKVLPKLHGTRGKLERPLKDIFDFCYPEPVTAQLDANRLDQALGLDGGARYPRTAQKIARMLRELEEQGYTSFIQ